MCRYVFVQHGGRRISTVELQNDSSETKGWHHGGFVQLYTVKRYIEAIAHIYS